MNDTELFALSVLQLTFLVGAHGENEMRKMSGSAPAYTDGSCYTNESTKIQNELLRRDTVNQAKKCTFCNGLGMDYDVLKGQWRGKCCECNGTGTKKPDIIPTPMPSLGQLRRNP